MAKAQDEEMTVGTVVRDRKWGGTHTGTVVRRQGDSVFVAWHNSCVEDELDLDEVDIVPDAPEELVTWRAGIEVVNADGTVHVRGVSEVRPERPMHSRLGATDRRRGGTRRKRRT